MNQPLIEPSRIDIAKPFQEMAERIRANAEQIFGGAFVVIPPANGGDSLETLILDLRQDPAQFWSILKVKCDLEIGKLDDKNRQSRAFGMR